MKRYEILASSSGMFLLLFGFHFEIADKSVGRVGSDRCYVPACTSATRRSRHHALADLQAFSRDLWLWQAFSREGNLCKSGQRSVGLQDCGLLFRTLAVLVWSDS
jgi:hypothetical protein